jgi:hypothetical protein
MVTASPAGLHSCCRGVSLFVGRGARAAVCEVDPAGYRRDDREGMLMPHPDLTVGFAHRSLANTFTVTPEDSSREDEGSR